MPPSASIFSASGSIVGALFPGPAKTIFPSLITTAAFGIGGESVPTKRVPLEITVVPVASFINKNPSLAGVRFVQY